MKNRVLPALALFVLLPMFSCAGGDYSELDRAIGNRTSYVRKYQWETLKLSRKIASAPSDSLRWVYADSIFINSYDYSVDTLEKYSSMQLAMPGITREQRAVSLTNLVYCNIFREQAGEAFSLFKSLDTNMFVSPSAKLRYIRCGSVLYHKEKDRSVSPEMSDSLEVYYARRYIRMNPESFYSLKLQDQIYSLKGDSKRALETLLSYPKYNYEFKYNEKALIFYKIGRIYYDMGNIPEAKKWLTESAILDIKYPSSGYMSLYYLSEILFSEGDLSRAERYITNTFEDMLVSGYNRKIINSAKLLSMISSTLSRQQEVRRRTMSMLVSALIVLIISLALFLFVSRKQSRKLSAAQGDIIRANSSLEEANRIMNGYVFNYMDLSLQYLDRMDQYRHNLSRLYKTDSEGFMEALRSPQEIYMEYKKFYSTFDRIFLEIYPSFVQKVNEIMNEDSQFVQEPGQPLSTELRILAAIKLGISDTRKIAMFLRCSVSTVYNYRARMRNSAKCSKDEFENLIRKI